MTEWALRMMQDTRLSEAARIIGLWVMGQESEDGWVELRFDTARALLYGFPSDDVIRKHLRMLKGSGWAERKPGGKGNGDRYRILDPAASTPYKDRLGENPGLKPDSPASEPSLKPFRGGTIGGGDGEVRKTSNSAITPPVVPPGPIDPAADDLLEENAEVLTGCRDSLRDYLALRVSPDDGCQKGYVATVVTLVVGSTADNIWSRPDGAKVKPPDRPAYLAAAMNALLAAKEGRMAAPVGDPRNLKTKLRYAIREGTPQTGEDHGRGRHSANGRAAKEGVRSGEGIGANQGDFTFEGDEAA